MSSTNEIDVVFLIESRNYLLAESEGDTSVIFSPSLNILVGIRPEQVAEKTSVRNISRSHDSLDLLER